MYIKHPLLRENSIFKRDYQIKIVEKLKSKLNYLVILPTGTGKTTIILIYLAEVFYKFPNSKVIFVAPTRPLVKQHFEYFSNNLLINKREMAFVTGEIPLASRKYLWNKKLIFSTPQVLVNDIIRGYLDINNIDILVIDEAHHAIGNHAYTQLCSFITNNTQIIGLTASPGDIEKTREIMSNIHADNYIVLTREDVEIKKFFPGVNFYVIKTTPDDVFYYIIDLIKKSINEKIDYFNNKIFFINNVEENLEKLSIRMLSFNTLTSIKEKIQDLYSKGLISNSEKRDLISIIYQLNLIDRLLRYVESYGWFPFIDYYEELMHRAVYKRRRAERDVVTNKFIYEAYMLVKKKVETKEMYPKLESLLDLIKKRDNKIIIFVSLRSIVKLIHKYLSSMGLPAGILVGKQEKGMNQKRQIAILEHFKNGDIRVLITTQIGEEGLDISECDTVIFYDHPISAIRRIQRIGRTGRTTPGQVYFIINPKTRDESRFWAGVKKEKLLMNELKRLLVITDKGQLPLDIFSRKIIKEGKVSEGSIVNHRIIDNIHILADYRELASPVVRELKFMGLHVELTNLEIGDYLVGSYIVERKTYADLATSIIDGRLFSQLKNLSLHDTKLLIIEGNKDEFIKRLGKEVLEGTLISIALDFKIPIIFSDSPQTTASFIYRLAAREAKKGIKKPQIRKERKPLSLSELQKYIVAGLPDVDTILADRLLRKFKTIERVFTAPLHELITVKGIGPKIAEKIKKIITSEYNPPD